VSPAANYHPVPFAAERPLLPNDASLVNCFEASVRAHADRLALASPGRPLTYRDLNRSANRIAHAILAALGRESAAIALLCADPACMIAAMLAALKAGKCYVPLDAADPAGRNAGILADAQARLLLTDSRTAPLAAHLQTLDAAAMPLLLADTLPGASPADDPRLDSATGALSAIYYTSGSSGQLKGVMRDQRVQLHDAGSYVAGFGIGPQDRVALLVAPSVGMSDQLIFGALLSGATLCPFDLKAAGPGEFAAWLAQAGLTVYASTPALYRRLFGPHLGDASFPHLRLVWLTGEPVIRDDVTRYRRYFRPPCLLVNALGTVETGDFRRYIVRHDDEITEAALPAGYAVDGKQVVILDGQRRELPPGQVGEIAVRSAFLARGYWNRPELTATRFLPAADDSAGRLYLTGDLGRMRADGCLEYLGRADRQVKVRGYRVEPTEIEAALAGLDAITEAAVAAHADARGDVRLTAYLVSAGPTRPDASWLRQRLAAVLPDYMIPAAFIWLPTLPLGPTGKLDRGALPPAGCGRPDLPTPFVRPMTPLEAQLADIWAEALGVAPVGLHDSFIDLGGDSLQAMRVLARVFAACQVELTPGEMFACPTVAGMAAIVVRRRAEQRPGEETAKLRS
jgi:amino acid adenylation domain-containing protein